MSFRSTLIGALALSLLSIGTAQAQTAPTGGAAGPVQPSETKQFSDWMVRCYPVKSPSPCDMFELLANKQNQQRILSISIAYVPSSDKHVIQIAVPLGVLIQKGLVLSSDAYTSPMLHYRRCDRGGCYVEMLLQPEAVSALASGAGAGKIIVYADAGKAFEIPFSLKGFNEAHGAMQDLARKKTQGNTPPPEAPAPAPAGGDATPAPDQTPTPSP
ncbi:MAG: invasion associated locus B family protein [Rhizomicrobium sp.]